MIRRNIIITMLAVVLAACGGKKPCEELLARANEEFQEREYVKCAASLNEVIDKHKAECDIDDLCQIAALYMDVSNASVGDSEENMLKAARVYSYAEEKDQEAARQKMESIAPGAVAKMRMLMRVEEDDDIFENYKKRQAR